VGVFVFIAGLFAFSARIIKINTLGVAAFSVITLWAIYVAFNGYYLNISGWHKHSYLLICFAFFAASLLIFNSYPKQHTIFPVISIIAGIESLICVLQFFKIVPSLNLYFAVTGTWVNPNVTAMYLAMSFPALLYCVVAGNQKWKKIFTALLFLVVLAVILLKCRTAIIGILIASVFILQHRFQIIQWINTKFNKPEKVFVALAMLTAVCFISFIAWNIKKESAEGRILIWKLSAGMGKNKPGTGYGYGMFERNYNLVQAAHFKTGNGTDAEKKNATQAFMAYNEYLENLIEGGIGGFTFFIAFTAMLLYGGLLKSKSGVNESPQKAPRTTGGASPKNAKKPATPLGPMPVTYAGILTFTGMSLINFTFTATPAMCLFMLYAAMLVSATFDAGSFRQFSIPPLWQKIPAIFFVVCGSYIIYFNAGTALGHHQVKSAIILANKGDTQEALNLLKQQPVQVKNTEIYCRTLGALYINNKRIDSALIAFQHASLFTSSPDLYIKIGNCQQALHQYNKAIDSYNTALNIQPSLFAPRYALLQLFIRQKDSSKVIQTATDIINLEPKVLKPEIKQYKEFASRILLHFKA